MIHILCIVRISEYSKYGQTNAKEILNVMSPTLIKCFNGKSHNITCTGLNMLIFSV